MSRALCSSSCSTLDRSCVTTRPGGSRMKAGIVQGWVESRHSTWPSGHYIPQSRNRCPRPCSWLRTHNGHPLQALRGGPSLVVGVQADNGPHLRLLPSLGGCHAALNQRSGIKPRSPLSDRYKGAGLIVQVQASIIKSESCPGQDLWRV